MEFLRDEDINKIEPLTQTSEDKTIIDSGAESETKSKLGDPAVEGETSEALPNNQGRKNKKIGGKQFGWLHIIGKNRE